MSCVLVPAVRKVGISYQAGRMELIPPISTSRGNFQSIVLTTLHSSHHARWGAIFSCARIDEVQQGAEITDIVRIRQVQVKVFLSEKLIFVPTFVEVMYVFEVPDAGLQTHIQRPDVEFLLAAYASISSASSRVRAGWAEKCVQWGFVRKARA